MTDFAFPSVVGANLAGRYYRLPVDLEGSLNLLGLVYLIDQQTEMDSWTPTLARFEAEFPGFRYYELPTLGPYPAWQRQYIDDGMRAGIPDPVTRARTITLYLDVAALNRTLGIETMRMAQYLLVNRAGQVLWRGSGSYTWAQGQGLLDVLDTVMVRTVR